MPHFDVRFDSGMMMGTLNLGRHLLNDLLGERGRLGRRANQHRGFCVPHNIGQADAVAWLDQPATSDAGLAYGTWKSRRLAARSSVISPERPVTQNRRLASSGDRPSRTITSTIISAMPMPAVPAPWMTTRWSRSRDPAARTAENAAADDRRGALHVVVERANLVGVLVQDAPGVADSKSSQCSIAFGNSLVAVAT